MFTVGDKVWCLIYGQGVVTEVNDERGFGTSYPTLVKFQNKDDLIICYTNDGKHFVDGNITLFPHPVEIVKAITKPSIDWSHVREDFQYLAMDSGGNGYLCGKNPHYDNTIWLMEAPYIPATAFTSYVPGTCDWKDSLVERPV